MPIRVLCPNGHELVAADNHVGRKVRCPACQVVMIVPDPNPQASAAAPPPRKRPPLVPPQEEVQEGPPRPRKRPAPPQEEVEESQEEAYEEEPIRKQGGMKTRSRMRLANIGLGFHYAKVLCLIASIAIVLLMGTLTPLVTSMAMVRVLQVLSCFASVLVLITPVLGGTGSLLCFWIPPKARSRVLVIVSFGLEVGGTVLMGLSVLMMMSGAATASREFRRGGEDASAGLALAGGSAIVMLLGALIIYAGFIIFMLFLRALALYLRDNSTAEEAMRQMILYLIVTIGGGVLWFGLGIALRGVGQAAVYIMLAVTVGWMVVICVVLFAILNIIGTVRQGIATRW